MQCQNCGANAGIAVPHRNLNNAIIYMVIDHCSYDFFTISYWHRISDISTAILTFDQGRQKWPLLTPKKSKYEGQKKGHSPNPCWHGLFAKKTGPNWSNLASVAPFILYIRLKGVPTLYSVSAPR